MITRSLPDAGLTTAASSPIPLTIDWDLEEASVRWRSALIKPNSPLDSEEADETSGRSVPISSFIPQHWPQRFRRSESRPASMVSTDVEKEKRRCPSPEAPKTIPGTAATCACSSKISAATRLSGLILLAFGNA